MRAPPGVRSALTGLPGCALAACLAVRALGAGTGISSSFRAPDAEIAARAAGAAGPALTGSGVGALLPEQQPSRAAEPAEAAAAAIAARAARSPVAARTAAATLAGCEDPGRQRTIAAVTTDSTHSAGTAGPAQTGCAAGAAVADQEAAGSAVAAVAAGATSTAGPPGAADATAASLTAGGTGGAAEGFAFSTEPAVAAEAAIRTRAADAPVTARPALTSLTHEETASTTVAAPTSVAAAKTCGADAAATTATAEAPGTGTADAVAQAAGTAGPAYAAGGLGQGAVPPDTADPTTVPAKSFSAIAAGSAVTTRASVATVAGETEARHGINTAALSAGAAGTSDAAVAAGAAGGAVGVAGDVVVHPGHAGISPSVQRGIHAGGPRQAGAPLAPGATVSE